MGLPEQVIPETKKDQTWAKKCVRAIIDMADASDSQKEKDKFCHDLYNGIQDESTYNYLTRVGDYEFPAKIRFVPLLRPRLDRLRSEESRRPMQYRVVATDEMSLTKKLDRKTKGILDVMMKNALTKVEEIRSQRQQLQQAMQMTQGSQQDQQGVEMEMAQLQGMLRNGDVLLGKNEALTREDIAHIEHYYSYEDKDLTEILMQKGMKYLMQEYYLKDIFSTGFDEKLKTDKEIYKIDWKPGMEDPTIRIVNPLGFYYSHDEDVRWIGECQWVMEETFMTINQIIDEFKYDPGFTPDIAEKLSKRNIDYSATRGYYNRNYNYLNPSNIDGCDPSAKGLYAGSEDLGARIRVCFVEWSSPRELKFKRSPNKYMPGVKYTHWMDDNDVLREYDEVEVSYINDIWEGVLIDQDIFLRMRKKPVQLRSVDRYGKVENSYIGKAYNYTTRSPYSIVWAAKDLQIMYNLIHYHKELWIALAGVKGFIMDKSQLPKGMSPAEWQYQKKMGTAWIESLPKNPMDPKPTFNQFQVFDDTLPQSIKTLIDILTHLEDLCGTVTGVSRQNLGDVAPTDQVGTNQMSIQQSSLVTEILHHDHEQVRQKAMERMLNLCRIAWKKGKKAQFAGDDFSQHLLDIPEGAISNADYKVYVNDSGKEMQNLNQIRSAAMMAFQKGGLSLSQFTKTYSVDSIIETEKMLERYEELAAKRASENLEQQKQAQMEAAQMEQQFEMMMQQQQQQFESVEYELKKAELQLQKEEIGVKIKQIETQAATKQMDTAAKRTTDLQFLEQEKKEAIMDYNLELLKLQLQGVETKINALSKVGSDKSKTDTSGSKSSSPKTGKPAKSGENKKSQAKRKD